LSHVKVAASISTNAVSFFISPHNETLSVAAMCVSNPDHLSFQSTGAAGNVIETREHAVDFNELCTNCQQFVNFKLFVFCGRRWTPF
jgi:hypothetical protein